VYQTSPNKLGENIQTSKGTTAADCIHGFSSLPFSSFGLFTFPLSPSPLWAASWILSLAFCVWQMTTTMFQFYILLDLVGFDFWIIEGWVCAGSVAFWGGSFTLAGLEDWVMLVFSEWRIKWRHWKASFELVIFFNLHLHWPSICCCQT